VHVWQPLTQDGSVRYLKYRFGPGTANTLAVRLEDGTWLVISPATGVSPAVLDDLAKDGAVSALVAPNAFHHLGQAPWRRRFPSALSYAADEAFPRLARKSPDVSYRSTSELKERVRSRVDVFMPLGLKAPDLMFRISVPGATVWWMGDLFSNNTAADQVWWLRLVAPLAGSGLGYRRNAKPGLIYVRDRAAWLRSMADEVGNHPPTIVIPAHGDPVLEDAARRTRQLLDAPSP
jgi:glyoxylase-like metal-dependent hydrolase (beta-lactamase superfamily II)